jgi:chromosomal replication initiation ATPase DnaA
MDAYVLIDDICKHYNLDVDKMLSNYRKQPYPDTRKIIMVKLKENSFKLKEIAIILNKSNHTVISNGIKKHYTLLKFDKKYKAYLESF